MNIPAREELELRLQAFVADLLDRLAEDHTDGFDMGALMLIYEAHYPREGSPYLKRSDARYTPDDDVGTYFSYWCSDHRPWVQVALAEAAANLATANDTDDDDESDEKDGASAGDADAD